VSDPSLAHLTSSERKAIDAFVERLQARFPGQVLQVTLFGSKARGDSGPWSDIDLLIVVKEESWPLRADISHVAARVSFDYNVLLGPRVIGQERWQRMKRGGFGLYRNVIEEGIPLTGVRTPA